MNNETSEHLEDGLLHAIGVVGQPLVWMIELSFYSLKACTKCPLNPVLFRYLQHVPLTLAAHHYHWSLKLRMKMQFENPRIFQVATSRRPLAFNSKSNHMN